jgi:TolB-like protein
VIDGDDIHGDGVNIAARLEGLAEPGGICISGSVHEQIRDRIDVSFEDLGEQPVKNIDRPVRVWQWIGDAGLAVSVSAKTDEPLPLPDKPSIAVLPFTNMSGDSEQEYFADGIAEDIITELSRFRSLFVIARNSSFHYKDRSPKVQELGRELGVQYVVEGSVRKAGNRVRITAQLVESESGNHIWAERYDRDLEDIFAVQDEVTQAIVSALAIRIEDQGYDIAKRKPPDRMLAYDYWLRGKKSFDQATAEGYEKAHQFFTKCIEADPDFARGHAGLAEVGYSRSFFSGGSAFIEAIKATKVHAEKAVTLDDSDAQPHYVLAWVCMFLKQFERARQQIELTTALNPNDADLMMHRACILALLGEAGAAVAPAETAIRLNPHHPGWYLEYFTLIRFAGESYDEALAISAKEPDIFPSSPGWRGASCAYLGRIEEARLHAQELIGNLRRNWVGELPDSPVEYVDFFCNTVPFRRAEDTDRLRRGLLNALQLS